MNLVDAQNVPTMQALINMVQLSSEPVIVANGQQECLVVMTPQVLDRLLFDVNLLNWSNREASAF